MTPVRSLERVLSAAERLPEGLPFVRVEFYEVDSRPLFSETTFYPGSGLEVFGPRNFDLVPGAWRPRP
jgi:hypothetical protein